MTFVSDYSRVFLYILKTIRLQKFKIFDYFHFSNQQNYSKSIIDFQKKHFKDIDLKLELKGAHLANGKFI